jgi:hypothetical protein
LLFITPGATTGTSRYFNTGCASQTFLIIFPGFAREILSDSTETPKSTDKFESLMGVPSGCVYYYSTYYKAVHGGGGGYWRTCFMRDDNPGLCELICPPRVVRYLFVSSRTTKSHHQRLSYYNGPIRVACAFKFQSDSEHHDDQDDSARDPASPGKSRRETRTRPRNVV